MNHIDGDRLAAYALDATEQPTPGDQEHLQQCDQCAVELAELRQLITAADPAHAGDPLHSPPHRVWESITAELGTVPAATTAEAVTPGRPVGRIDPTRSADDGRSGTRSWWAIGLVAALVGVLVGVLGTVAIRTAQTPAETVVSEIALNPLPGKAGSGQATLINTPEGLRLRVSLSGIEVTDADLEVWLINTDGEQMRSLGLAGDSGGTFNVPGWFIPDDYRIVDVSVEPHDGNLNHSTDSEVRGTLP